MSPYDVLGVAPDASDDDVARAYKTLAKRHHPDLNPSDAAAAARMGEINRAYDDIRAMRRRGGASPSSGPHERRGSYYDPYYAAWRAQNVRSRRRGAASGRDPLFRVVVAVTVFLLVRFLLSAMFGGYRAVQTQGYAPRVYGYYDIVPEP